MTLKSAIHLIGPVLFLGVLALSLAPAQAKQNNFCDCLVTESSPCTCTENFKISPLATHSYVIRCDADGNGKPEFLYKGYGISWVVRGRDKMTACSAVGASSEFVGGVLQRQTEETRSCTNWSLTKKDSVSTVVTCTKN